MRLSLSVLIALAALASAAAGQTYVTGDITTSQTWYAGVCSPYIIQADIEVNGGSTLTIEPGVTVKFDGDYRLGTYWDSAIYAVGTAEDRITFTSNAVTPAADDWTWVQVWGSNTSTFTYCIFEYAEHGLRPNNAAPIVTHCVMRHCLTGIYCAGGSPTVTHCNIHSNHTGVAVSSNGNPTFNYCDIHDNSSWNVHTTLFDEPLASLDFEDNWWGTNVESEIAQEVYDNEDNPEIYVLVDYEPWNSESPVKETTWGRVKALLAY
jgi:hypothetical protein